MIDSAGSNRERARQLVMQHGWNASCYNLLNPQLNLWISPGGEAAVGYLTRLGIRVAAGAPACAPNLLEPAVDEFEEDARLGGEAVCWFGAEGRLRQLLQRRGRATLQLGLQPVWDPQEWRARSTGIASLRAQLNRARNKGVTVGEWVGERSRDPRLTECLEEWLETRGLPPLHFLTESRVLHHLGDRRLFVAHRKELVDGFVVAAPVPAREGWLLEQVVRRPGAPNGVAELMIDHAANELSESGATYLTLGLAPLARRGSTEHSDEPLWVRALWAWLRAHGRRFYDFGGLEYFKSKFRPPHWDPLYLIDTADRHSPRTLYAVAAAFSDGPLPSMLARALLRAATREARRAVSWLSG